jgi:hypothetical protein
MEDDDMGMTQHSQVQGEFIQNFGWRVKGRD